MSPRAAIVPPAVDVQVSPVWTGGRYVVRITVGRREPVDLTIEQAERLGADLHAAVRLARHHAEQSAR